MKWYEKHHYINGTLVNLIGLFEDSEVSINAIINVNADPLEFKVVKMYSKPVNMWVHQEILAEDILSQYQGMIKKCENKLSSLVEREKLDKRI